MRSGNKEDGGIRAVVTFLQSWINVGSAVYFVLIPLFHHRPDAESSKCRICSYDGTLILISLLHGVKSNQVTATVSSVLAATLTLNRDFVSEGPKLLTVIE